MEDVYEEVPQEGGVVRSRERASLRIAIQTLEYSNSRKTRREVDSLDSKRIRSKH